MCYGNAAGCGHGEKLSMVLSTHMSIIFQPMSVRTLTSSRLVVAHAVRMSKSQGDREMSVRLRVLTFVATLMSFALALTAPAFPQSSEAAQTEQAPLIDPQAMDLILRSARFLANQNAMSFNWFVSYDEVIDEREKITLMRSGSNLLVRDKGFVSSAEGENGLREWYYDGTQVTYAAPLEKYYASSEFKNGFDALVDAAREDVGSEVPLYSIMQRGLPERLEKGLKAAAYLGTTKVADQEVYHLAFSDDEEDWQVWISTDEEMPVPVVIIGTEPKKTGWPQYRAYLTDWSFDPEYDEAQFKYVPAEDDVKISFPELKQKAKGQEAQQ
jgi:hypothetical protein